MLCDTLTYIGTFEPELVIDIATLSGACMVALRASLQRINHNPLAHELMNASEQAGDRLGVYH